VHGLLDRERRVLRLFEHRPLDGRRGQLAEGAGRDEQALARGADPPLGVPQYDFRGG